MDRHVCTDDIDSLQSAMQIFIGRVYMGNDTDKQDKNTMLISDYCLYIEYIGRMIWGHLKLLWGPGVARGPPFRQRWPRALDSPKWQRISRKLKLDVLLLR